MFASGLLLTSWASRGDPMMLDHRGSSGSSVKSIHERFRLLLDVHPIVTLNDLVLFHLRDNHRPVGQLCTHEGAYFAYEK